MAASTRDEDFPEGAGTKAWRWAREILIVLVLGVALSVLIRTFVAQVFEIPSGSMENTLQRGDRVVVQKITGYARGDVVVFADPANWLADQPQGTQRGAIGKAFEFIGVLPDTSTGHLIKRVIGLPGDTVECCDAKGYLSVNGKAIDETSYLFKDPRNGHMVKPSDFPFKVTVPQNTLFMMGDHRNGSRDSRCYLNDVSLSGPKGSAAFVPTDKVVGKAWFIVYPFDRIAGFSTPNAFSGVPDAPAAPKTAKISADDVTC